MRTISEYKSPEACIWRGNLSEGLLSYELGVGGGGAYIWRGLYMEGPVFGILRYIVSLRLSTEQRATLYARRCKKSSIS